MNAIMVKAGQGLVEEEDTCAGSDCAGDGNALGLTEGDLVARGGFPPSEAKTGKNGVALAGDFGEVVAALGPGEGLVPLDESRLQALAFRHWGGEEMPNSWSVEVPGGRLGVRMFPTEEGEHVSLSGPAELVYRGTITLP